MIWVGTDDGNVQLTRDGGKTLDQRRRQRRRAARRARGCRWVEAEPLRRGHRLRDVRPPHLRRHDARTSTGPPTTARPGRALVAADRAGARLRARHHGGPRQARPAVPRDRARACGSRSTAASSGRSSRAATSRTWRCATSPSTRATTTWCIATHGRGIWIVDDITPLRALTPEVLAQEAAFLRRAPAVQRLPACGGWVEGDAKFVGPEPARRRGDHLLPADAPHLRRPQARGPRRRTARWSTPSPAASAAASTASTWSMRMKPPRVPPAADRRRRHRRARGSCRAPTRCADQGQEHLHHAARRSCPTRARSTAPPTARRSSTLAHEASTRCSAT